MARAREQVPAATRRRLVRTADDRVVAGVAGGLGRLLGVDPVLVRIGFVVLTMAGGVGLVAYGALWALTPATADGPPLPRRPTVQQALALSSITLGVLLLLRRSGLWFGDGLVWPVVVAAAGSAIVWTRGEGARSASGPTGAAARWTARLEGRSGPLPATSLPRVVVGTLLVTLAVAGFLAGNVALVAVRELGLAVLAAAAGIALLFGPWISRVVGDLSAERRERVRQEERAELAAHLHDSVLQTLALIQRSGEDARRMSALARVQERELRAWLYGSGRTSAAAPPRTLTDAVEAVAADLEARDHLAVDVVVVGDVTVDERVEALLGAVREALTNVAKHAQVTAADVYVEADDGLLRAYVRDRGVGFDPAAAPTADDQRRGLRDSIRGRLARHDGHVRIDSAPGRGTEVELTLPLREPGRDPSDPEVSR